MVRISNIVSIAAVALALGAPSVAGSAEGPVTRDLTWSGGDQFGVAMSARVTFTPGPQTKITVTGPREVVDRMFVDDGVVKTRQGLWNWRWNGPEVTIAASAPHVRSLIAAASARIETAALQEPSLNLRASSSGSIRATVKTGALRVDASSSGSVHARGNADRVAVDVSSSGRVDLGGLAVQDAVVDASSSGSAELSPTRSARVEASSSGHVRLLRRPAQLDTRTSSSGHVSVS
jgi:hypothetical protein